jgi:hypothetical protein
VTTPAPWNIVLPRVNLHAATWGVRGRKDLKAVFAMVAYFQVLD